MEMLRSTYTSRMTPYRDRPDVSVAGQWHYCSRDARPLPFFHFMGSDRMLPNLAAPATLGEDSSPGVVRRSRSLTAYPGLHYCGAPDAWLNGVYYADRGTMPVDVDGVPQCCQRPDAPLGGLDLCGQADVIFGLEGGGGVAGGFAARTDTLRGGGLGSGYLVIGEQLHGGAVSYASDGDGCVNILDSISVFDMPPALTVTVQDIAGTSGLTGQYLLDSLEPAFDIWESPAPIGPHGIVLALELVTPGNPWRIAYTDADGNDFQAQTILCLDTSPPHWYPPVFGPGVGWLSDRMIQVTIAMPLEIGGGGLAGGGVTDPDHTGGGGLAGGRLQDNVAGGGGLGGGGVERTDDLTGGGGLGGGGGYVTDLTGGGGLGGGGGYVTDLTGGGGLGGGDALAAPNQDTGTCSPAIMPERMYATVTPIAGITPAGGEYALDFDSSPPFTWYFQKVIPPGGFRIIFQCAPGGWEVIFEDQFSTSNQFVSSGSTEAPYVFGAQTFGGMTIYSGSWSCVIHD